MKSEILFFVPEWPALDHPILHAQVLSVAAFLRQRGFSCRFVGAERSPLRASEAVDLIEKMYDIRAYVEHALPHEAGAYAMWMACKKIYLRMCSELSGASITHVYARSFTGSFWSRRLAHKLNAISIFDVRGIVNEEQRLEQKSRVKAWVTYHLELHESCQADRLSTVSQNLRTYLCRETGRQDITVIPSCFNEDSFHFDAASRQEIRQSLGIKDEDVLLCYSGGTSAWQRITDIVSLLKGICTRNPRCKALFLTNNVSEVTDYLTEARFPANRGFVRRCAHAEVHRFLSAADIGIIMRHDIPVNNVASPVKVAEYLSCGLPVILTRGIGDYSDMLPASGVGVLLDEGGDMVAQVLTFIERFDLSIQRDVVMQFAKSRLTMLANLDQYKLLYAGR